MTTAPRLLWVDHVRAVLTLMVVGHHAAQAYGPTGGAWPVANPTRAEGLGVFIGVNAMFFMSLFFFLSGYFTPGTLARKGARSFVIDRLWRLGIPSLVVVVVTALTMERPQFLHLWFVVDLLALNLGYVASMSWRARATSSTVATDAPPTHVAGGTAWSPTVTWLVVVTVVAGATALVRVRYPVDRWVALLGVLPLEPAHGVHYVTAFVAGLVAARARWLERLTDRMGAWHLAVALGLVALYAALRLGTRPAEPWFASGGASWAMVRLACFETVLCVTLSVGLLWLFRTAVASPSRWLGALAADAYGIYLVHLPLVIVAQLVIAAWAVGPWLKFALATTLAVAASWVLTRFVLRRGPVGRRIV